MDTNYYKYAVENKLRFPYKGSISVEDLFDLSLENLDSVYQELTKSKNDIKSTSGTSLLTPATKNSEEIDIKIEIVKDVFNDKKVAREKRENAAILKKQTERIANIIANKENEELNNMSIDELKTKFNELKDQM